MRHTPYSQLALPPPLFGSPAVSRRPVTLRPRLATGLPLSQRQDEPAAFTKPVCTPRGGASICHPAILSILCAPLGRLHPFRGLLVSVMYLRTPENTSKSPPL